MTTSISFYNNFLKALGDGTFDMDSHTFKLMLVNSGYTYSAAHTLKSDLGANEVANGNGYTTGGSALSSVVWSLTGAAIKWDAADKTFTASGGAIGPFRYGIIYDDTATSDPLLCCIAFSSNKTIDDGDSLTFIFDAAGIFTIT